MIIQGRYEYLFRCPDCEKDDAGPVQPFEGVNGAKLVRLYCEQQDCHFQMIRSADKYMAEQNALYGDPEITIERPEPEDDDRPTLYDRPEDG